MKKIAFIVSLLVLSGGFTPAQAAQCKDGTYSSSTGRGTCSGHGGVASWDNAPVKKISSAAQKAIKAKADAAAKKAIKAKADAKAKQLGFKNAAEQISLIEEAKQVSLSSSYKKYDEDILNANNMFNLELQNINTLLLPKSSLVDSQYNSALLKWKEIDQVKITNDSIRISKIDVTFFNSRFGLSTITLSSQDQNRYPGPPQAILGKIISGTTDCCAFGSITGGRVSVYELIVSNFDAGYKDFNWDLEQEYSPSIHMSTAAKAISAFQQGWMWSVRQDGSKVNYIEFETIRNNIKSSYANKLRLEKEYQNQVVLTNAKFAKLIESIKSAHEEEIKAIMEGNLTNVSKDDIINIPTT